ncbi:MAG: DNA/RNA nuclease SfsA [Desulfurococcales archaeon]|nr:DNA/RNA nuclease SfsA [Desulfurococcales archaeon]
MMVHLISASPVLKCLVIERINRFTVRVRCLGSEYPALNTNTGRLPDLLTPGRIAYCIRKYAGKLPLRLLGVDVGGEVAVTDIHMQVKSFEKALELNSIPWLTDCLVKQRNPVIGNSRLDYLLKCPECEVWMEVKSAVLIHHGVFAGYPDCLSLRGRRHIQELIKLALKGRKALLVFIAAHPKARAFKPYSRGDPQITELLKKAMKSGVRVRALQIKGIIKKDKNTIITVHQNPNLPVVI